MVDRLAVIIRGIRPDVADLGLFLVLAVELLVAGVDEAGVELVAEEVFLRLAAVDIDLHAVAPARHVEGEALGLADIVAEMDFLQLHALIERALGCESIVEPQEERGESEGGEDVEEQTGAGTDVRSRLDVRFGLQLECI